MSLKLFLKYLTFFIGLALFALSALVIAVSLVKFALSTTGFMVSTQFAISLGVIMGIGFAITLFGTYLIASHTES